MVRAVLRVGEWNAVRASARGGGEEHKPLQHGTGTRGILLQRRSHPAQVSVSQNNTLIY